MKMENRQSDSSKTEPYASRLREERVRVEPHQGKFCARIGISRNRQSFFENGEREMRGEYLELIARHGLDVSYILTGQRGGDRLDQRESMLLSMFRALDDISQCTILLSGMRMAPEGAVHFTPAAVVEQIVAAVQGVAGGQLNDLQTKPSLSVHESGHHFRGEGD